MPAMKVFSSSLSFMKNKLLETCKNQGIGICDSDLRWVVTVPAIWTDVSKQFTREAAEQVRKLFYKQKQNKKSEKNMPNSKQQWMKPT